MEESDLDKLHYDDSEFGDGTDGEYDESEEFKWLKSVDVSATDADGKKIGHCQGKTIDREPIRAHFYRDIEEPMQATSEMDTNSLIVGETSGLVAENKRCREQYILQPTRADLISRSLVTDLGGKPPKSHRAPVISHCQQRRQPYNRRKRLCGDEDQRHRTHSIRFCLGSHCR